MPGVVEAKRRQLEQLGAALGAGPAGLEAASPPAHPLRAASWEALSADLGRPGWMSALLAAGLDPQQPTVWVAEGVWGRAGAGGWRHRGRAARQAALSFPASSVWLRQSLQGCPRPLHWPLAAYQAPPSHACNNCAAQRAPGSLRRRPRPTPLASFPLATVPPWPGPRVRPHPPHSNSPRPFVPPGLLMYLEEDQVAALLQEAAGGPPAASWASRRWAGRRCCQQMQAAPVLRKPMLPC